MEQVHPYLGRHFGLAKYPQIWPVGPKMTRKCPQMTSRAPRNEIGTGSPISRPTFWDQFELGGYPQICPRRTQNDPLMAQNAYKSPHWSELVGTTWNKVWNRFSHVQADILGPITPTVRWVPPNLVRGAQKWTRRYWKMCAVGTYIYTPGCSIE